MQIKILSSAAELPESWDTLHGGNPSLRRDFFVALEESGCAAPLAGWQGHFLLLLEEKELVGGMPLFFKTNSYGEFVFDWAWADAYERNGLKYYPKLISAVPFTPISGMRAIAASGEHRRALMAAAMELARGARVSSFHCLFPPEKEAKEWEALGLMLRNTVQFHWRNAGYRHFDEFLAGMKHEKRKKIKKERARLVEAGITYRRIRGTEATEADWKFFTDCYLHTHAVHGSPPSLNLDFFLHIGKSMPENLLLVMAYREGKAIGSALDFFTKDALYGRSWGAFEYHPGLHFEVCYYQAIEFCIENGIDLFEGGAQGEHKLARGFLPVTTWSAHWLAHPQFASAVQDFLEQERGKIALYVDELNDSNPFKRP